MGDIEWDVKIDEVVSSTEVILDGTVLVDGEPLIGDQGQGEQDSMFYEYGRWRSTCRDLNSFNDLVPSDPKAVALRSVARHAKLATERTNDRNNAIRLAHQESASLREIAEVAGVSHVTVNTIIERAGEGASS